MTVARKEPMNGNNSSASKQIYNSPSEKTQEQLLDDLMDFLCETDEYNYDVAKHDAILAELAKFDSEPVVSKKKESFAAIQKKYPSLFTPDAPAPAPAAAQISPTPSKKRSLPILKVLSIAAVLVFILAIGASAFGLGDIFGIFRRITSEWLHVGSENVPNAMITAMPLEIGEKAEYDTLQDALDAFGIHAEIAPNYIPERFRLDKVQAVNTVSCALIYADYISEDGFLSIQYREITPDTQNYEHEGPGMGSHICAGVEHIIMENLNQCSVYWQSGELNCTINGTVSREEMIQMIDSIYEGD